MFRNTDAGAILLLVVLLPHAAAAAASEPLPSWQAGDAKHSIIGFVTAVTGSSDRDYVPPGERTLWSEKPVCFQRLFSFD